MKRALLTTIGTYGDVYPILAVAKELKKHHYTCIIATQKKYQKLIEDETFQFIEQLPDWDIIDKDPDLLKRMYHPEKGARYMFNKLIAPRIKNNLEILSNQENFDLIFTTTLTFATEIYAELTKTKLVPLIFSPITLFSKYDPPKLPFVPVLDRLHQISGFSTFTFPLIDFISLNFRKRINKIRKEVGLKPLELNPLTKGYCANKKNLALLPSFLLPKQIDWPSDISFIGFPFYSHEEKLLDETISFMQENAGKFLVYTLGSSFLDFDNRFYSASLQYHQANNIPAIFIIGDNNIEIQAANIHVLKHAPYSKVFPQAKAIIHQGGIGTCAQALKDGIPQIIVPSVNDQPENAHRLKELNCAHVIPSKQFNIKTLTTALSQIDHLKTSCDNYQKKLQSIDFSKLFSNFLRHI